MRATIAKKTSQRVTVDQTGGGLVSGVSGITLKNQISEITHLDQMDDVVAVDLVSGSTLIYDETTKTYQIKKLNVGNIGIDTLDGGTF